MSGKKFHSLKFLKTDFRPKIVDKNNSGPRNLGGKKSI